MAAEEKITITLADIQRKARNGAFAEAEADLRVFLSDLFNLKIVKVEIRQDTLSLNSVNGLITLAAPEKKTGATTLFFKFHHEENEEAVKEYYNSALLAETGFPVEKPLFVSRQVGRQVLIYPFKTSERFADVCKRIELSGDSAKEQRLAVAAQERLDEISCKRYIETLHEAEQDELEEEPLLQLFYYRLVDGRPASSTIFGGRYSQFYAGKMFEFPGKEFFYFEELCQLKWRINGVSYAETLGEGFEKALQRLAPAAHKTYQAVVAHGDAHNGNVWYNQGDKPYLSLFDPAFAGKHIPALLAEIKPTFHNIFAHPLWLYDAPEADKRLEISCKVNRGIIDVTHNWSLSPLRTEFLRSKRDKLWIPLLKALKAQNELPWDWQSYVRAALFCCPTLVMNLRANSGTTVNAHTPKTSLLGVAISLMLSSPPAEGQDIVSGFFEDINSKI